MCGTFFNRKKNTIQILALVLLFINLLLTGTRAAIVPFLVCLILYILIYKGLYKAFKYCLIGIISLIIVTPLLPDSITHLASEITESIIDVIIQTEAGNEKFGGSSVDARTMQIAASMEFLKERPFFGHGIGYANKVLLLEGKHESLLGMESYICWINIEFGIIYAITIILFFVKTISYLFQNRKYAPNYAYMGIFFIIMYLLYLVSAWVGSSWYIIMPVLGYITKITYLNKRLALILNQKQEMK